MSMSKKDFIALDDSIREYNSLARNRYLAGTNSPFNSAQILTLADFCEGQGSHFDRERWLGYINGENGPNGGAVKEKK